MRAGNRARTRVQPSPARREKSSQFRKSEDCVDQTHWTKWSAIWKGTSSRLETAPTQPPNSLPCAPLPDRRCACCHSPRALTTVLRTKPKFISFHDHGAACSACGISRPGAMRYVIWTCGVDLWDWPSWTFWQSSSGFEVECPPWRWKSRKH